MTAPYREINVRLHRDCFSTPWGFRLQGGRDFKGPLTVQRVFVGSPADGELQRGDVILSIGKHIVNHILHKQAQDIIKDSGGSLDLVVRRGLQQRVQATGALSQSNNPSGTQQAYRSRGFDTFTPKPDPAIGAFSPTKSSAPSLGISTDLGTDYGSGRKFLKKAPSEVMLNRVNQSLHSTLWMNRDDDDIDYTQRSIKDLKNAFSGPTHLDSSYRPHTFAESYSTSIVTVPKQAQPAYVDLEDDVDYVAQPVKDLKKRFLKESDQTKKKPDSEEAKFTATRAPRSPHKWRKPAGSYGTVPAGLNEPGWAPSGPGRQGQTEMGWTPMSQHAASRDIPQQSYLEKQSRPAPRPVNLRSDPAPSYQQQNIPHYDTGAPAWVGSLKGSRGPKPWEVHAAAAALSPADEQPQTPVSPRTPTQNAAPGGAFTPHQPRVQNVHYGPEASAPQYQQLSPSQAANTDSAKVAHLQYNSPLQLYSRENAEGVLKGQTGGKPGEGTMAITGGAGPKLDLSKSETYRLIHEQERGGPRSARYVDHHPGQEMQYHGYQDQKKQSPSMQALQAFVSDGPAPSTPQGQAPAAQVGGEEGTGYSDF